MAQKENSSRKLEIPQFITLYIPRIPHATEQERLEWQDRLLTALEAAMTTDERLFGCFEAIQYRLEREQVASRSHSSREGLA